MLTQKQHELLQFIHLKTTETGVSPSFDEMKDALALRSKSGVHRLITALEERGFIRRLPNRARALEILKMPQDMTERENTGVGAAQRSNDSSSSRRVKQRISSVRGRSSNVSQDLFELPLLGKIAAGTPIEAIQHEIDRFPIPSILCGKGDHFLLEVEGESMIEAGINDGDFAVIEKRNTADSGDIVVALVDGEEATLKRLRKKGGSIALEPANPAFETRIYGPDRISVQGKLVGLVRKYN